MANRRMIDKKISISEDVANLPLEAQLLFTWMIVHADDVGLLPYSSRSLKALVVPMIDNLTTETISLHLETIKKQKLIEVFNWEGDKFWRIKNFLNHQTLKKDRSPQSIAKNMDSWKQVETIWNPMETQGREGSKEKEESKQASKGGYQNFLKAKKQIGKKI